MDHGFATSFVRQDHGLYRVECLCGDVFTDHLPFAQDAMRAHLDLFEQQRAVDLGPMSERDVLRLRDAFGGTCDPCDADDVALLNHLTLRLAQYRKRAAA